MAGALAIGLKLWPGRRAAGPALSPDACLCGSLVDWWTFNDSGDPRLDSVASGADLASSMGDAPPLQQTGLVGQCAEFTGGGYLGDPAPRPGLQATVVDDRFNPSGSFYTAGWVRFTPAPPVGAATQCALAFRDAGSTFRWSQNYYYYNDSDSSYMDFFVSGAGNVINPADYGEAAGSDFLLDNDAWNFVAAWYDADAGTLNSQVNNGPVVSVAADGPATAGTTGGTLFVVGGVPPPGSEFDPQVYLKLDEWIFVKGCIPSESGRAWLWNNGNGRSYAAWLTGCS